jgi:hypothetical protein
MLTLIGLFASSALAAPETPVPPDTSSVSVNSREADARVDRGLLHATAETQPKGTFTVSNYELVLFQAGYSPTDWLQVSVTTLPPYFTTMVGFVDLSVKANLLRTDRFRVAGIVGGDLAGTVDSAVGGAHGGVIGQVCLTESCRGSVSLNTELVWMTETEDLGYHAGLPVQIPVSKAVSVLLEPMVVGAAASPTRESLGAFGYGVRIAGPSFGADLGMIKPIGSELGEIFLLGLPVVSVTFRG